MKPRKPTTGTKSDLVWRISAEAPEGKWVDPTKSRSGPPKQDLPEVLFGGWASSSFDLLSGSDVNDAPDTVPDALFDELFPPPKDESDGSNGSTDGRPDTSRDR